MKKRYIKPSMKVYQIEKRRILCGSPGDKDPWLNYAPAQPTDEKHLA